MFICNVFLIVCFKNFFLLTFLGQQWGIGYRKAYKKGERYGFYSPKAKFKGDEQHLMHIYTEIGSVLSKMDAVAQLFPQQYLETFKAKANVEKFFIPDFDNAMGANVFISEDYCIGPHLDRDVGYTIVLWLLKHSLSCPHQSGSQCIKNWYFHLWSDSLIVELSHGTVGFFDSTSYIHGTLSGEPTNPQICKPLQIGVSNQNMKRLLDAADQ